MQLGIKLSVTEKGKKAPEYTVGADLGGEITLKDLFKYTKESLIIIANQVFQEEIAKGFPKDPLVIVDGRKNKPIADVDPIGKIQFVAKQSATEDILLPIYDGIVKRSPMRTGTYKDWNVVLYNGNLIAGDRTELDSWLKINTPKLVSGDVFIFVNVTPYAGSLERKGISAGREKNPRQIEKKRKSGDSYTINSPNGAYYLTSRSVRRKSKFNSKIFFQWLPGRYLGQGGLPRKSRDGKKLRHTFKPGPNQRYFGQYVYPSIRVIIDVGGLA